MHGADAARENTSGGKVHVYIYKSGGSSGQFVSSTANMNPTGEAPKLSVSELKRRFSIAFCSCRKDVPFRGKQICTHQSANPTHIMGQRFKACLACLQEVADDADEEELKTFLFAHQHHAQGNVNSRKSKEYFAARATSQYLKEHNKNGAVDGMEITVADSEEEEEEDETVQAVAAIEGAVVEAPQPHEDAPEGFDNMAPPASQWHDWTSELEELFGGDTPRPPSPQLAPPPPPLPPPKQPEGNEFLAPSIPNATDSVFPVGSERWASQQRNELKDKIQDKEANNRILSEKIKKLEVQVELWKKRCGAVEEKEEAAARREANAAKKEEIVEAREKMIESSSMMLEDARARLAVEKANFEKEVHAFSEERELMAKEKARLHRKEKELADVALKLRTAKERAAANRKITELHVPLAQAAISADPTTSGCVIGSGDGCGHLRLKPKEDGGVEVVSYYNTAYSKRPPTTKLHKPPATRPKSNSS